MKKIKLDIILLLIIFTGCSKEIIPLEYGKDKCEQCSMVLTDIKYGAEIITVKGITIKFDATGCMLNYLIKNKLTDKDVDNYYVVNFSDPGIKLLDATKAFYLLSAELKSPMGANISAYPDNGTAERFKQQYTGVIYSWNELKDKLK